MVTKTLPAAAGLVLTAQVVGAWPATVAAAAAGLVLAGLGTAAATALLVYSPTKLGRLRQDKALVTELQVRQRHYELLAWLLLLGGIVATTWAIELLSIQLGWASALATAAVGALFALALPLGIARRRSEVVVLRVLPLLRGLWWALRYPVLVPLQATSRAALRALRIPDQRPRDPEEIADAIMAALTDSAQQNALEEEERHWIENIVELKDLRVCEAMTPRTDVVAFEAELPLTEAVHRAIDAGHSRYPVYEDKVDRVVGVFYARDALARLGNGGDKNAPVRELMRAPLFVPESMGVIELLRLFKAKKLQLAIVLDEYGGTAGLISIEDILEEIVGDISDEFDTEEEESIRVLEPERLVELSGRARVDELNELIGELIPEDGEYDTVAGYVFTTLGKIPKVGERVSIGPLEFEIMSADDRRIGRMRLTLPEPIPTQRED